MSIEDAVLRYINANFEKNVYEHTIERCIGNIAEALQLTNVNATREQILEVIPKAVAEHNKRYPKE